MKFRANHFLFVLILAACSACGQGTIQYVDIAPDLFMFSAFTRRDIPIDLDQDGVGDFVFRATPSQFDIYGLGSNRVLAYPNNPPDLSRSAAPLTAGDAITPSLQAQYIWAESIITGSSASPLGVLLNGGFETIGGPFVRRRGYVGLEFQIGGNLHYGWIQLDCEYFYHNGGYVLDYAYELRPGTTILAGAVPEPSAWALFSVGLLLIGTVRKRRRRSSRVTNTVKSFLSESSFRPPSGVPMMAK